MGARTILVGAMCAAMLAAGGVAAAGGQEPATDETPEPSRNWATVTQRDLVRTEELDGVVSHGAKHALRLTGDGTITKLPAVDDIIGFGQPIAEVNGEPVILIEGARPAWRTLGAGIGKGEDIRQLETALVTMGYADPAKVEVDDTWTAATTAAVKLMQKFLGLPEDGRLDLGEVVFATYVVRVADVGGSLGDAAAAADIEATGLDQSIELSLAASKFDLVDVGTTVGVELPSGQSVVGEVVAIGQPVVADDGSVSYPVSISTDELDVADGVPVEVTVDIVAVADAVAVPAEALLALAEGGYAVEMAVETADDADGTGTRLVGVDVGAFADGWVQITGEVQPGDQVVVP